MPYAGGPKSGCSSVEPACIDVFHTLLFVATGSLDTSMFQTLSAGKTRQELPGTGARAGSGAEAAGWNTAAVSISAAIAAAERILPLMTRIIGIPTAGS